MFLGADLSYHILSDTGAIGATVVGDIGAHFCVSASNVRSGENQNEMPCEFYGIAGLFFTRYVLRS